uniref:Uncharacterized protein n=1 Tax=Anguilla anguilla TaxID=7936 RepID=A0A0E9PFV3_ANGAN
MFVQFSDLHVHSYIEQFEI